jgi:myosin heavy subunit
MLRKIIIIVAIVAALAVAGVNIFVVKDKITTLTQDRNDQRSAKETAQHQLAQTKKDLAKTQDQLAQTQTQLADSQKQRDDAVHKLVIANTQIDDLNGKLAKTSKQLDDTQNNLAAYTATGLQPPQIQALNKNLKNTQDALDIANEEKTVLTRTVAKLNSQIKELIDPQYVVALPANLKGTVMAVDPKWDFIVINVGEDQGVLKDGELLVSRDGKLVAKVVVRSVQKDRSIANFVPGWQLGDIMEGDQVIPAHPATS